jgi:hypothetical protein
LDGNECDWICYVTVVRGRETGAGAELCGKHIAGKSSVFVRISRNSIKFPIAHGETPETYCSAVGRTLIKILSADSSAGLTQWI